MKVHKLRSMYRTNEETGAYIIDIHLDFYRELFNEWDFSPMAKRDFDEDLIQYLLDSLEDIPKRFPVEILFSLPQNVKDPLKEERSLIGWRNHLAYRLKKVAVKKNHVFHTVFQFLGLGFVLFSLSFFIDRIETKNLFFHLIEEFFLVGSWVLIWEAFAIVFFQVKTTRATEKKFRRLLMSQIGYNYRPE